MRKDYIQRVVCLYDSGGRAMHACTEKIHNVVIAYYTTCMLVVGVLPGYAQLPRYTCKMTNDTALYTEEVVEIFFDADDAAAANGAYMMQSGDFRQSYVVPIGR
jgi:hypothetical protein